MVRPEKVGNLHLVYHFTVPLKEQNSLPTNNLSWYFLKWQFVYFEVLAWYRIV